MKYIGAHVSASGGVENAPLNAEAIGAKAFALFTKNQKRWVSPDLTEKSILEFRLNLDKAGISADMVLPHDSYLINLGNPEVEKRAKSLDAFIVEAKRARQLGLKFLNFHPGSHLGKIDPAACLDLISEGINSAISETESVIFVIETTAGQGNNVGYKFEHLADIIENIRDKSRIGVCIDTCHIFAAGYDIRTKEAYNKTMEQFDTIVGMKYLKGFHLNDAKSEFESRVDRHD
ncbi:MAG: deoxyribonuclease IV, partial [Spirochaetales bacterium]|nr:deoxyribonuclease IV [Spirochaetales bacterium]